MGAVLCISLEPDLPTIVRELALNQSINYFSDGYKLWANLAIPDRHQPAEKHPGIIECPGFQHGVTDPESRPANLRGRNRVNQTLLEEGYVILSPHCRGMGRSQGRTGYLEYPKTRVNPFEQAADLMNGITYLQSREEVGPGPHRCLGRQLRRSPRSLHRRHRPPGQMLRRRDRLCRRRRVDAAYPPLLGVSGVPKEGRPGPPAAGAHWPANFCPAGRDTAPPPGRGPGYQGPGRVHTLTCASAWTVPTTS